MKKYLLTAAATLAIATPAAAVDNTVYVGGDIGGLIVQKSRVRRRLSRRRRRSAASANARSRPVIRWASMRISAPVTTSACSGSRVSLAISAPA